MTGIPVEIIQIANGYGAGNIGDELMGHAFWQQLPEAVELELCLFPEFRRQHLAYPSRFTITEVNQQGSELFPGDNRAGILVGTTLVSESEGIGWPLEFIARRLKHFHDHRLPVDAIGVGVDRLETAQARAIFQQAFLPIRSWTVRSEKCREALLDLGVPSSKILVGADFGWLHESDEDISAWAKNYWTGLASTRRSHWL